MEPPKEIYDQEARLATFCLNQASFAFFRHGSDGRFLSANRKACESLGYTLDELLSLSVFDIDPTLSAENWPDLWQKMCAAGSITFEAIHRRKDGTTFPVEITANLLEFESRRFATSFVQEITQRKRTEETLRLTQFAYRNASMGIFRSGADARILDVNQHACKSLGYSAEELCKMTIHDIDLAISIEGRADLWQQMCEKGIITFESAHRRKDGSTFPVHITANLLEYEGQKYSITFVRDITEQKRDEEQKESWKPILSRRRKWKRLEPYPAVSHTILTISLRPSMATPNWRSFGVQRIPSCGNISIKSVPGAIAPRILFSRYLPSADRANRKKNPQTSAE